MLKEKKMFIGLTCNNYYAKEQKILFTALLLFFSIFTIFQFFPISQTQLNLFSFSSCVSNFSSIDIPTPLSSDEILPNGVIKRRFQPYGLAAYAFILMSAYRSGPSSFSLNGLSSKPLHVFGKPSYTCKWVPHNVTLSTVSAKGQKALPDWGYGRVYTTVVITCTFPASVTSGKLLLVTSSKIGNTDSIQTDTIEALVEKPEVETLAQGSNMSSPKYDYLYCGSSLYGDLSPQRLREWIAYHIMLFGNQSHFVFYDAGGVNKAVMDVLRPWMELGYVTVHDVREQERFDGYYHNQFLIVNDCLNRYRSDAKWIFFFDVDEFLYFPNNGTIKNVTDSLAGFSQFTFEQMTMSNQLCLEDDRMSANKRWGFEKLVYRDVRKMRRDRKYAVQPKNVFATGVHLSQHLVGKTCHKSFDLIKYFHYHGSVNVRNEPCREFTNATFTTVKSIPYVMDTTMRDIAPTVREFELNMIGPKLNGTRQ